MEDAPTPRVVPACVRKLIESVGLGNLTSTAGVRVVGGGDELSPVEAGKVLGISASTVRRYEAKGWLKLKRRLPSGHRRYSRDEVAELKRKIDAGELHDNGPSE